MSDADGFHKPFDASQAMLQERLLFFLNTLHPQLREDVMLALGEPGKLFSVNNPNADDARLPSGVWSLLTLLLAQYITPNIDIQRACSVAIAIECYICALDLLDDIEDMDQTSIVVRIGTARVLNVSTTLLVLTDRILLSLLKLGVPSALVLAILDILQEVSLSAVTGQHRDILAEQIPAESFTLEECIAIAEGKAGSLMSLAFCASAIGAGANNATLLRFSELGKLLGIAHQLDNDCHDLYHIIQHQDGNLSADTGKTDIMLEKKTLPIVIAAHIMSSIETSSDITEEEKYKRYTDALHEGIITTWGISLLYRERAYEQLRQVEVQYSFSHALHLLLGFV